MNLPNKLMMTAGLALCLASCQTQQQIAKNQAAAQEWLNLQKSSAGFQIGGTWFSDDWGRATLKQTGRNITGTLDNYEVKGVVSGGKAYLTTWEGSKCYYAVILSPAGKNVLKGSYTDGPAYLADPAQQRPVEFRRSY